MKIKVVCGLPRSGTSMLMYALKKAGLKVAGKKWGDITNKQANPTGYWESEETNRGLLQETKGDVIKIMFNALYQSNPDLIEKFLVIVREPKKIVDSVFKFNNYEDRGGVVLNMCLDCIDSFAFIKQTPAPHLIVDYDEVIKNPSQMRDICSFMGGDYQKALKAVKPELNRRKGIDCQHIEHLEAIYQLAGEDKLDEIIKLKFKIETIAHGHISTKKSKAPDGTAS